MMSEPPARQGFWSSQQEFERFLQHLPDDDLRDLAWCGYLTASCATTRPRSKPAPLLDSRGLAKVEVELASEPSAAPHRPIAGAWSGAGLQELVAEPLVVPLEVVVLDEFSNGCAEDTGFSLHADVWVGAHDRERLERLCRYVARPAIATERLCEREDGRIEYGLRRPWRDGTTGFVFEPGELIEKLVALVPAPRGHLVRYHGVLASRARWRAQVVRDRGGEPAPPAQRKSAPPAMPGCAPRTDPAPATAELRERRLSWAELMRRVFAVDVLECPRCGGRRKLIAAITDPAVIAAFLASVGLPTRAPPRGPHREQDGDELDPGESEPVLG
jgi:hypothetical protein